MGKLFGTDGVRGIPGKYPLTAKVVSDIAALAAPLLLKRDGIFRNGTAPLVLLGRDTRASGPALGRALVEGFKSAGCQTLDLGVAPTPAVSYMVPRLKALCGVVVSASHNPAQFNGIKFVTSDGFKMAPSIEDEIEHLLSRETPKSLGKSAAAHKRKDGPALLGQYVEFLRSTFPATQDLAGLKIVVDCGHGASAAIAPALFRDLGATVIALGCAPDGKNINSGCGALYPEAMRKAVLKHRADCGVSFDGDADRAIFADEKGRLLDGDALICLAAVRLKAQGLLRQNKVVLTVMSNYGLLCFLKERGISVVTVPVGDRHVSEIIEKENLSLGGEASGHIIFRSFAVTGDGMLTAVQTLAAVRESSRPLSAHRFYRSTPQILKNIEVARKVPLAELPRLSHKIKLCENSLKDAGRIFVRYSGTEPLLRIMVEGPQGPVLKRMAQELADVYLKETGQK